MGNDEKQIGMFAVTSGRPGKRASKPARRIPSGEQPKLRLASPAASQDTDDAPWCLECCGPVELAESAWRCLRCRRHGSLMKHGAIVVRVVEGKGNARG